MLAISTRSKVLLLLLCCGCWSWQACNIINPAEQTPTYIHIDSFHFVQNTSVLLNPAKKDLAPKSHQINVAYVYYNNNPIGIFDLPVTFPVLATANGQLQVSPGVLNDGQNNDIENYPYYTVDTFSFAPSPGKTIVHNPQTEYYSDVQISTISNFEDGHTYFWPWEGTPGNVGLTSSSFQGSDSVFDGLHSGIIALYAPSVDSSIDSSFPSFIIPPGTAYIEFDYNSTVPFYVGLQANLSVIASSTPFFLSGIYPGSGWQKFYLEVDGFTASAQGTSYNFYVKAILSPGQTSGRLLIDNIQLVSFNQ